MDPLTIIASAVGISRSVTTVAEGIRWITSLKNAPLEFLDLHNELETVQGYLDVLRRTLEPLQENAQEPTALVLTQIATCLPTLNDDVTQIQQLSASLLAHWDDRKRVRKINWRRHQDIVAIHRDRIRRRRVDLAQTVALLQPAQG
ncbi:hypothetical protein QBC35DRAFT_61003 [Podospora australis]|uniref:Fungal N-terminal domain-containing protein n=1 Tax=Podospora australis TaxID=1536484 RepID=A0AAN6WMV8_9PEZI|nr:hypothetical protein QBC35DRAFT_61003 [Podospora australis]